MTEECPKCKAKYPDVITTSWSGGGHIVETSHHCKKCGATFRITHNCNTGEDSIKVKD